MTGRRTCYLAISRGQCNKNWSRKEKFDNIKLSGDELLWDKTLDKNSRMNVAINNTMELTIVALIKQIYEFVGED